MRLYANWNSVKPQKIISGDTARAIPKNIAAEIAHECWSRTTAKEKISKNDAHALRETLTSLGYLLTPKNIEAQEDYRVFTASLVELYTDKNAPDAASFSAAGRAISLLDDNPTLYSDEELEELAIDVINGIENGHNLISLDYVHKSLIDWKEITMSSDNGN